MRNTEAERDTFFAQYIETLLWSEIGDDGEPLDSSYDESDLAAESVAEMRKDCDDFVEANIVDLADIDAAQAGHDFALCRNGHGAGFWDQGLGDVGDRLSDASEVYGTQGLYVGDDGELYVSD